VNNHLTATNDQADTKKQNREVILSTQVQIEKFGPSLYNLSIQFGQKAIKQTMNRYSSIPTEQAYYHQVR
jgi:hypothetical protein